MTPPLFASRLGRHAAAGLLLVLSSACHILRPGHTATVVDDAGSPSDARRAGIALVANNVEIGYALLVPARAADPDVVAYAARMHTDHASLNASLTDLLARLDLPAEDDPAGLALRDASAVRRAQLRTLGGTPFDVAYIGIEVESHRELLDVIDRVLAPGVSRRELRDYVAALRPAVAAHLAHAEQLRATLAARHR